MAVGPVVRRIPTTNHSLQAEYLPQLDELVVSEYSSQLKKTICVSLSADGWRDRIRRNWISLGFYFMVDDDGVWRIEVIHPDLIPISISSTSEAISELIADTVDVYVRVQPDYR